MRLYPVLASLALLAPVVSGCAHTLEGREDRVVVAVDTRSGSGASPAAPQAVELTEAPPMIITEPVTARPRLARTLTLGEGTTEPVYVAPPAPQAAQGSGPNVVVNNNITVVSQPPAIYGGYQGYGGRSNGPVGPVVREGFTRSTGSHSAWAASGWEGAGRTARPGQTPGVGGNWAPAPSHGPRAFR